MARLAKLNLLLFKTASAEIYRGNSLIAESPFDAYSSRCDFDLNQPPFRRSLPGTGTTSAHSTKKYPLLSDIIESSKQCHRL
jgi:hypothetical protein